LHGHLDLSFSLLPVALALTGIATAYGFYARKSERPGRMAQKWKGLYTIALNKFYIDEVYLFITRKWLFAGLAQAAAWVDKNIIDEIVHSVGDTMQMFAERIKKMQSGSIQQYTLYFIAGLLCILIGLLYMR
jgi:NADH-quinone oxidoreductase subunit L